MTTLYACESCGIAFESEFTCYSCGDYKSVMPLALYESLYGKASL